MLGNRPPIAQNVTMRRLETKTVYVGGLPLGGGETIRIQSMCSMKTERVDEVVAQINRCAALGASLMRVSVLDEKDAKAIKEIRPRISIPLVADIHFDYRLALLSIAYGADAIRLNPGNIGKKEDIEAVVNACKEKHIPIRIGVNAGSLEKEIEGASLPERLLASAKKHVGILESFGFHDIVLSLKASSVLETIKAYRLAAKAFPYPLHIGLTEAGPKDVGLIRSSAALSPLLLEGIGDTIRISLSDEPEEEIKAAKRLLIDLGLEKGPRLISCPTCGRTEVNLLPLAKKVQEYLEMHPKEITVAIMGCPVNGPGEAKEADIGIAGGKKSWTLFKKGKVVRTIPQEDIEEIFFQELENL